MVLVLILHFFLDLIVQHIVHRWVLFSLLGASCMHIVGRFDYRAHIAFELILLLLFDFLHFGIFGLCLLYLLPLIALARFLGHYFASKMLIFSLFFACALLCQEIMIKKLIFGAFPPILSTLWLVSVNLGVMWCLWALQAIFGMWGNRSR